MSEQNDRGFREFLKRNVGPANQELRRDLWPQMLRRMDEQSVPVPWFDWALLGVVATCLLLFPKAIPVLLYHL